MSTTGKEVTKESVLPHAETEWQKAPPGESSSFPLDAVNSAARIDAADPSEPPLCEKIAQLMKDDSRVGWPTTKPPYESLMHGWFFTSHEEVLLSLLDRERTNLIIELGTWLGKSADYFCRHASNAIIFCVDLWDNDVIEKDSHYISVNNKAILQRGPIYDMCLSNLWKYRYNGNTGVVPMKMDGCEALKILKTMNVDPDLVYIDASHHYDGVVKDVSTAIDLFPSAHIVGDDWEYPDVQRAVKDCSRKFGCRIYVEDNKCWTFSKEICERAIPERKRKRIEDERIERKKRDESASSGKLSFQELLARKRKASNTGL